MKKYRVRITMQDGSHGEHHGLYVGGFEAVITAMDLFPDARRISAVQLPPSIAGVRA